MLSSFDQMAMRFIELVNINSLSTGRVLFIFVFIIARFLTCLHQVQTLRNWLPPYFWKEY